MRRKLTLLAAACAAAAVVVVAPIARAAATGCDAAESAIYTSPAVVAGSPGTVLACRPVMLPEVPGNIAMRAWKVQYVSTDLRGKAVAVSGLVAVPAAAWTGPGTRPIVSFHFGTLGLGNQCAFSKQLAGAYQDEYEGDQIAAILRAGWAVAATDDIGYLDGQIHTYMVGKSMAHATLDAVRAAAQVPGAGLSATTKVATWGYSQGGAASLWSAQIASAYAPDLNLVGAAAGGIPADLRKVGASTDGGAFNGLTAASSIGLHEAHPALPLDTLMNDKGRKLAADLKKSCLIGSLAAGFGTSIKDLTTAGLTLDQFLKQAGPDGVTWGQVLDAQKLGVDVGPKGSTATYQIGFPVLQYHGVFDEVIPTAVEEAVRNAYCKAGITTQNKLYAGGHMLADNQAIGDVVTWLTARFAGTPTKGNC
jgi:hypothetical protein